MKNLVTSLLMILAVALPLRFAHADDVPEMETSETLLEPAQVAQREQLLIKVSEAKIFSFEQIPDREAMKEALGLKIPDKVKEQIIARGGSLEEIDPLQPYESMTPESQKKFQDMRVLFLSNAARILSSTSVVFGVGSLVGDALSVVKSGAMKAIGKGKPSEPKEKRTFQQRRQDAVAAILKGIDYKLFSQAPLVIESNEFGLSASVGIVAETGVLRKGGGGAEELGFSLAYNKKSRAFVFELFHNSEVFDNTKAAVSVVGVVGKAGISLGRREGADTIKGSSFYPPAVPGYSSASPDYFSAGLSSSLGLPPPPLADLLTFTNKSERHNWVRITVSPVVKGFVRLQIGDVRGSFKLVAMKFVDLYNAITNKVNSSRRACGPVFG
ncbi:hypothetical protein [Bdellovibrio sp. NC01]|uniref:hypothetical protein n=1 Tax=Bdellovibrio sp. NC01 TaxID=2220073 RepID=UPI00115B48B8|nr:hypothetical protein [Bdellovibrio sp. NC01]QDK38553.1 hypothetical protein DOE51_13685 [Bdellovibrio sp. NC01]